MVNFAETLWGLTALAIVVGVIAFVQSRGGEERRARYARRMRRAFSAAAIVGVAAIVMELWLRFE